MCGRFTLHSRINLLLQQFAIDMNDSSVDADFDARYNIAPTQSVPVIRTNAEGVRQLDLLRWGLIPSWAKEKSIGARMINARSETIATKPAFRAAYKKRRCLVPADGYYEWIREGKTKKPFLIFTANQKPFTMAGLWESWKNPEDEALIRSFTIITTDSNDATSHIHDRMPVIIDPENHQTWMDPETSSETIESLLQSYDSNRIEVRPVSTLVNSVKNDDPACLNATF